MNIIKTNLDIVDMTINPLFWEIASLSVLVSQKQLQQVFRKHKSFHGLRVESTHLHLQRRDWMKLCWIIALLDPCCCGEMLELVMAPLSHIVHNLLNAWLSP